MGKNINQASTEAAPSRISHRPTDRSIADVFVHDSAPPANEHIILIHGWLCASNKILARRRSRLLLPVPWKVFIEPRTCHKQKCARSQS